MRSDKITHLALFEAAQSKTRVLTTCSKIVPQAESTVEPREATCLRCIAKSRA